MKYFSSIKTKMMVLLLGIIILTIFIVTELFVYRLSLLQEEAAHSNLIAAQLRTDVAINDMKRRLFEVGDSIVNDQNIIAGMDLIVNYQDRNDYQSLVFDPPKKAISDILHQYARNGGMKIAAIYYDREPEIFYLPSDAGQVSGYFQYEKGVSRMIHTTGDEKTLRPPMFMNASALKGNDWVLNDTQLNFTDEGVFIYEISIPLFDIKTGEDLASVPILRLGYQIDKVLLESLAGRAGVGLHLRFGLTALSSDQAPRIPSYLEDSPSMLEEAKHVVDSGELFWDEFREGKITYTRGVTFFKVLDKGLATLSYVKGSNSLDFGIEAIKYAVLWMLPFIIVILIFIGQIFANRTIIRPVKNLTRFASELADGRYKKMDALHSEGELGQLEDAFNTMTGKLLFRENELKMAQSRINSIIDNAPAAIYLKALDGQYLVVNNDFLALIGKSEEETIDSTDYDHFPEKIANTFRENDHRVMEIGAPLDIEEIAQHFDGSTHYFHSVKFPVRDDDGEIIAIGGISSDITERKTIEQSLSLSRLVIENSNEAIIITDLDGTILEVNKAYEQIMGYSSHEVIGKNPKLTKSGKHDASFYEYMWQEIHIKGSWEGEIWDRKKNGEDILKWLSITTVKDAKGAVINYVGIFSDITTQKREEEKRGVLAYYDQLTKLPNRTYFQEQLKQIIKASERNNTRFALFYLSLENFKHVYEKQGSGVLDDLLVKVAECLTGQLRLNDTVSRLEGCEFLVLLPDTEKAEQIARIANKLIDALAELFRRVDFEAPITSSIGISIFPYDGRVAENIIKNADLAMSKVRNKGINGYHFYSSETQEKHKEYLQLVYELKRALDNKEFTLFYQPKIDLVSGRITGMEAFVRWKKPDGRIIPAADFIALAEETALIVTMGKWIISEVCRQTVEWNKRYELSLKVAVNLSACQFNHEDFIALIDQQIKATGIEPNLLELEVSENTLMDNIETSIVNMEKLGNLGVSLAIDHFGINYSSFSYLKRFSVNTLKMDKSFISELNASDEDASIARSITFMAHSLDIKVVAKGVELPEQSAFIRQYDCDLAQGFYFYKPLSPDDFEEIISSRRKWTWDN